MSAFTYSIYKLLSLFVFPLGLALSAMAGAGIVFRFGWRRLAVGLLVGAWSWLWLCSTPAVSDGLRGGLEAQFP